jgi:hypothetical protein
MLESITSSNNLEVFVAEGKMPKAIEETNFKSKIVMNYLKLETNE